MFLKATTNVVFILQSCWTNTKYIFLVIKWQWLCYIKYAMDRIMVIYTNRSVCSWHESAEPHFHINLTDTSHVLIYWFPLHTLQCEYPLLFIKWMVCIPPQLRVFKHIQQATTFLINYVSITLRIQYTKLSHFAVNFLQVHLLHVKRKLQWSGY